MIEYEIGSPREQQLIESTSFHEYRFDDGTVWTEFYRTPRGYLLRFPGLADFEVSADGVVITSFPAGDTDEATLEHLYVNQVVPLALSRQGRPAFHASVVTVPGGCIAFLGKTGMGKSTLAASFALDGAAFLTDDSLLIEERNGSCLACPSHPSIRLWKDSLDALIERRDHAFSYTSYSGKARIAAGDALVYEYQPLPLLASYRLDSNQPGKTTIEPLTGANRQMAWVENSFLLDITDKNLLARHFEWTSRISSIVPTFSLDYSRDYGMLAEVREAITEHSVSLAT